MDPPTPEEFLERMRQGGPPQLLVRTAIHIAASPDTVRKAIAWLIGREKPPSPLPPVPGIEEWRGFWRNHRRMEDCIGEAIGFPDEFSGSDLLPGARALTTATPEEKREVMDLLDEEEQRAIVMCMWGVPFPPEEAMIRSVLASQEAEQELDDEATLDLLNSPGAQYYFRVWLPCWILHRTYPQFLLRQARLGDDDAFDKLLRLDKSITSVDPVLTRRWHEVTHMGSVRDRQRFMLAMAEGPKGRLDSKAMRHGLAGLISQIFLNAGHRVTAPAISELFDSIERIRTGEIDRKIAPGQAFSKAVQRNRNWPIAPPKPDN